MSSFEQYRHRQKYRLRRARYQMESLPQPEREDAMSGAILENLKRIREREIRETQSLKDMLLRSQADMDNLRKRTVKEREETVKFANENLICSLLPILDDFDHAWKIPESSQDLQTFQKGISLIYQQLIKVLGESGLEKIDDVDTPFDPKNHEAITTEYHEDKPENYVTHIIRKGYRMKGRLIRPALVKVNKKPEKAETPHHGTLRPNPNIKGEPLG